MSDLHGRKIHSTACQKQWEEDIDTRHVPICICGVETAMTTAAPPEKMTNAQITNEAENLARDHDNEFPITARILREAARRLSAPALGSREPIKAANVNGCAVCDCGSTEFRVGLQAGDYTSNHIRVLECVHCQHQMPVPFQQGQAPAAPRVGDGWTGRKCPRCNGFGQDDDAHACKPCGGTGEEYGPLDAALSAPPAASADERLDLVALQCGGNCTCKDEATIAREFSQCRKRLEGADRILAAGFGRKK